ncbi:MAG: carboxypeptidase regulatory-like domain-containing protein [Gemmatimonadaceae bacterium]
MIDEGSRCVAILMLALAVGPIAPSAAPAQGITTATITGTVQVPNDDAERVRVRITNISTGYIAESNVRHGRFFASGLETGGPYSVEVRRIGTLPQRRDGIQLRAGEQLEINFVLEPAAAILAPVHIATPAGQHSASRSRAGGGGTAATISEGVLGKMPALNRDLLDFSRLVPELGTRFGGISGAGVSYRFNSYLIDGSTERLLNGNGMLSGLAGGKPISIEAVKEYQVLLAPYDPRYGDFAGTLINTVTKGGTNELHGSAFVYGRNEAMARNTAFLRDAPYNRSQFGFSVGGPFVRDRAHFFVASEFQRFHQPATGPFVGQSAGAGDPLPAAVGDIQRFETLLRGYGLEPGNGDRVTRSNPNANVFARVDFTLPRWHSRAMVRHNSADTWQTIFTRPAGTPRFPLTSNAYNLVTRRWSTAVQLFTQLPGGWTNELLVNRARSPGRATEFALSPLIEVAVPGSAGFTSATLVAGAPDNGQGTGSDQKTFEVGDYLTYHTGAHTLTTGARAELFAFNNISTRGQFGRWTFRSLDSLDRGEAESFRVEKDFGSATKVLRGSQVSLYLGDSWRATDRLTLNGGLRTEVLTFNSRPAYNPAIDSIYGRRTNEFPGTQVQWSPRLGFVLDLEPDRGGQLRGGAGIFAGRPPLAWIAQALRFDGVGTRSLICPAGVTPAFVPDPAKMPATCADGRGYADGLVNLIDAHLRMAEMFRSSLAYERLLPSDVAMGVEALYTRTLSDFVFVNPNLRGPQGTDAHGRVMYGKIAPNGVATPTLVSNRFIELIDLRNHGNGHALAFTGRLQKRFADRLEAAASYTRSRVRDVQSVITQAPTLTYAFWANSRAIAGRHERLTTGISAYEIAHRVLISAGWTSPARRWSTDVSIYYVGEAGVPFTYTDSTVAPARGDLNADGTNSNDPIYVPQNAMDPAEITFDGPPDTVLLQRQAFESFISRTLCLQRQRGRILARNSCSSPWLHTANLSLRQQLPTGWSDTHALSLDLEIFNVLNLLNPHWGLVRVPNTVALQHVRQNMSVTPAEPVFRFDPARAAYSTDNVESAYQLQLALRYHF